MVPCFFKEIEMSVIAVNDVVATGEGRFVSLVAYRSNLMEIRRYMLSHGITSITSSYSGGGDSGSYESMSLEGPEDLELALNGKINYFSSNFSYSAGTGACCVLRDQPFQQAIENFTWDMVDRNGHSGFENNDGGRGELTITMDGDRFSYDLEHYDNVVREELTKTGDNLTLADVGL